MRKVVLISVVLVPVLLGLYAGMSRSGRRGLVRLVTLVLLFDTLYALTLYYVYLRLP